MAAYSPTPLVFIAILTVAYAALADARVVRLGVSHSGFIEKGNHIPLGPKRVRLTADARKQAAVRVAASSYTVYWPGLSRFDVPLTYHGGRIMSNPISVYLIFYGAWPDSGKVFDVITGFVDSITSTAGDALGASVRKWWLINTRYKTPSGVSVTTNVTWVYWFNYNVNYKKILYSTDTSDDILGIVKTAVKDYNIKVTTNDIWVVITSKDIQLLGGSGNSFCDGYCAYHLAGNINGITVQYAFVGDPTTQCLRGCTPNIFTTYPKLRSPNFTTLPGADAIVDSLAHELAETVTDPYPFGGFYSTPGSGENGDLCADPGAYIGIRNQSGLAFNLYGASRLRYFVQPLPDFALQQCVQQ